MALSQALDRVHLKQNIHAALRAWHTPGGTTSNLLDGLLLVQARREAIGDHTSPSLLRLATSQVLLETIDELEQYDEKAARILRWRFPDDNTLLMVAHKLNISEHAVSRQQRAAIEQLCELLLNREMKVREEKVLSLEARLPPASYTRLIGLDDARTLLAEKLLLPRSPWTLAIVGIGGIGKTALADAVTRQTFRELTFEQIIWLRTEPQTMSGRGQSAQHTYENLIADIAEQLWPDATGETADKTFERVRRELKSRRYLIVVDNLESDADTAYLAAHINDLAEPSKFLLTSRTRPSAEAAIFSHSLEELSSQDAAALLRHHAEELGMTELAEASEAEIDAIYAKTGGNPLALKLVVSLLDVLPLSEILSALAQSRSGPVDELYRHIYWQSWQMLGEDARSLLLAMPLVARSGAEPEQLRAITNLSESQLWLAIQELRKRSLLEVRGTIQKRRYGIHRLTQTFLQTEIIKAQDDGE